MNYKVLENFLSSFYQLVFEHRIIAIILWFVLMFFLLRKLSKKDNEFYLKDFFKQRK